MEGTIQKQGGGFAQVLRVLAWGGAACLLLLPAVAMQFPGSGVEWTASDFLLMGAILFACCAGFELALRASHGNSSYLLASCIAIGSAFLIVWINLAVGIIGPENENANGVFAAVLALGMAMSLHARLRAAGMDRAMLATAVAQALVAGYALMLGSPEGVLLSLFFAAAWLAASALFRRAAQSSGA